MCLPIAASVRGVWNPPRCPPPSKCWKHLRHLQLPHTPSRDSTRTRPPDVRCFIDFPSEPSLTWLTKSAEKLVLIFFFIYRNQHLRNLHAFSPFRLPLRTSFTVICVPLLVLRLQLYVVFLKSFLFTQWNNGHDSLRLRTSDVLL